MKIKPLLILFAIWPFVFFGFNSRTKADSAYDLKAESLVMNSTGCEVNQICVFTAKVKNLGPAFTLDFPLKSNVSASNYQADSPTSMSPASGAVVKTDEYITFTISGRFTAIGQAVLNFSVDATGFLNESDSGNNAASLDVNVTGYDLAAESMTVWPASPMVNQASYILVKVKNSGSYKLYTEAGLNLVKALPDFFLTNSSSTMPSLANVIDPGGYLYYGYEGRFTVAGEKQLSFTVDPDDALKESDLANNSQNLKITIYDPSQTDLAIAAVSFSKSEIIMGEQLDITVGIKNTGKTSLTSAAGFFKSEFSFSLPHFDYGVSDLTYDDYPKLTSALNPGGIFHYYLRGVFIRAGDFSLAFSINKNRQLLEADYSNDATSTAVLVYKSRAAADDFTLLSRNVTFSSSTSAIARWITDQPTAGYVNYGKAYGSVYENKITSGQSAALEHAVIIDNLKPGENYAYLITASRRTVEKNGGISNFSTPADNALKIVSGPEVSVNGRNVSFSWSTNLTSSGRVYYKKTDAADLSEAGDEAAAIGHVFEINDLDSGLYEYFLSSTSTPGANLKTAWAGFEIKDQAPAAPAAAGDQTAAVASGDGIFLVVGGLYDKLKGRIILKVEDKGQAYYVSPLEKKMSFLGRPDQAFQIIRAQGLGITNDNLAKLPVGLDVLSGADSDLDGLPDALEEALGTDKNKTDTDGDGYNDKEELAAGYSPLVKEQKMYYDSALIEKLKGRILLQVEDRGEAWYISPGDGKRYFLARPADAFNIMRGLGLGISNSDYQVFTGGE